MAGEAAHKMTRHHDRITIEEVALLTVNLMAQQSLDPETYQAYLKAHNDLIGVRELSLTAITERNHREHSVK